MSQKKLKHSQRTILRLFMMGSYESVKSMVAKLQAAEITEIMAHLRKQDQIRFLELLFQVRMAALTLSELPGELARELINEMSDEVLAEMLRRLPPDDAVDMLGFLAEDRQNRILGSLNEKERWSLERLRLYEDDTAGGRMTTDYIALLKDMPISQALEKLRGKSQQVDVLYFYVIDEDHHLLGIVPVRSLLFADLETKVGDIVVPDPVKVHPDTPQEEVARLVMDFDLLAIPVVDEHNKILGIVTFDDIMEVMKEEATEDIYHLAGLDTAERVFTPVTRSVRLRAPWLLINLATAVLAAVTVSLFQDTISKFVVLAVMMPIVAGMGGNAGTQSLTVVVRALALGELEFSRRWRAMVKEVLVGLCTGCLTGIVMGLIGYLWYRSIGLSVILFVAMIANLVIAGLFGALVPLLLQWVKKDPALGSSIFVTTATDVGGFFVFLGLASLFIHLL